MPKYEVFVQRLECSQSDQGERYNNFYGRWTVITTNFDQIIKWCVCNVSSENGDFMLSLDDCAGYFVVQINLNYQVRVFSHINAYIPAMAFTSLFELLACQS